MIVRRTFWNWVSAFVILGIAPLPSLRFPAASAAEATPAGGPALNAAQTAIRQRVLLNPDLKPWQKAVLEAEVLPVFQAFVRTWDGKSVDIDTALLKDYLDFRCELTAEAGSVKSADLCDVWVLYRVEKGCAQCERSLPGIKKTVESRLTRRGYQIVPLVLDAVGIPSALASLTGLDRAWTQGKELNQRLLENAAKNRLRGVISIAVRNLPPDSPDDPHADELHFGVSTFQAFRNEMKSAEQLASLKPPSFAQFSEHLEFQIRDSGDALVERLMTEGVSQIAVRLKRQGTTRSGQVDGAIESTGEVELELHGIKSFQHASRVRLRLESFLKESPEVTFREIRYQRGLLVLGLKGIAELESWTQALGQLAVGDEALGEAEFLDVEKTSNQQGKTVVKATLLGLTKKLKQLPKEKTSAGGES